MIYSKSQAAFTMSAKKLFEEHPKVFFWTFTFRKVNHDWVCMNMWHQMFRELTNIHHGYMPGLRVVELHKTHGMHFHALIALRISVHIVRRVASKYGFGRIHVCKATEGAIHYLVPYLQKERELRKGQRSWAAIGGFRPVRVRDIEVDSVFHRNCRALTNGKRMHYLYARSVYQQSMLWGDLKDWKKAKQEPIRTYYLNPNLMFVPRVMVGCDERWEGASRRTVFSRNVKNTCSGD